MPNIFNADNGAISGSAGIKLSSDTSGVLNIQTNGTTAISISASQVVSFPATSGFSFAGQVTFAAGTAAAPSISVTGDTNTGIYFPAADTIAFTEGGVESARFDSSGNLGIGTTSPTAKLHVNNTAGTFGLRIDAADNPIFAARYAANADGPVAFFAKSRNATVGSQTVVQNGDQLGVLIARGSDGTNFVDSASITFAVDGTPGTNDMPGRIVFGTSPDGSTSIQERMRLDSSGNLGLGVTPSAWDSSYKAVRVNNFTLASQDQTGGSELSKNSYVASGGANTYIANGFATKYEQTGGTHKWFTAASGTAGNAISFTNIINAFNQSTLIYNRLGLGFPCELMFNGEYNSGGQDVAIQAGRAARIEYLKDEFLRFQGTASVAAGAGVAYSDKVKIDIVNGGILFGSDTAAANTLDDYEEGTWTPDLRDGGTSRSPSYSFRSGTYTKIGNLVCCRWGFLLSNKGAGSGSGEIQIYGLPFTCAVTGAYQEPNVSVSTGNLNTASNAPAARMIVANAGAWLFGRIANNGDTTWTYNDLTNNSWIIGEIYYMV